MGCGSSKSAGIETVSCGKSAVYLCRSSEVKHSLGITFEVQAHRDAILHLYGPEDKSDFEIVLGAKNNTMTIAKKTSCEDIVAEVSSLGILDPSSFHSVWVTWRLNSLCVGKGFTVGKQELCSLPMQYDLGNYKPYNIRVSCLADKPAIWRNAKLLFDEDY